MHTCIMHTTDGLTHVILDRSFKQRDDFRPICCLSISDFVSQPFQPQLCIDTTVTSIYIQSKYANVLQLLQNRNPLALKYSHNITLLI